MSDQEKFEKVKKSTVKKSTDKEDIEMLKEVLSTVSTEVPVMIDRIFKSLYNPELATEYGKGIGALYKELENQGMPQDMIRDIVLKFSQSINIVGDAVSGAMKEEKGNTHVKYKSYKKKGTAAEEEDE